MTLTQPFRAFRSPLRVADRRRESGVVLVLVLVFALLLASTVATFLRRATVDALIARNRESAARADAIARGGIRLATVLILDDKLSTASGLPAMDTRDDLWAVIGGTDIPIDDISTLRIDIQDASEKLNLNAVFQFDESGKAHQNAAPLIEAMLEKVIDEMQIPPGEKLYDIPEMATALIDYVDEDDLRIRGGSEDDLYQRRDPRQRAANRPLLSVDELRVVEGFDPLVVEALRPYVTVYPFASLTGINPNTAAPHVLSLIFFDDGVDLRLAPENTVREILQIRQDGGWICGEGTSAEACTPIRQVVTNAVYPPLSYQSDVFTARATATVVGVTRTIEAVIDRKAGGEPLLLSWRVL